LSGLHVTTDAGASLIDQATAGEGQVGPEAAGFIKGSPLAPNTPYDLFSSAPLTPGVAGLGSIVTHADYGLRTLDLGLTAGLGYVQGSTTNAAYWGESLMPTINPHLGSQALPYAIAFPTHAGQDDGTALRLSILSGSVATKDDALKLRVGWFDVTQTDRFVFAQPALTNVNPAIGVQTAESLTNGLPGLDSWNPVSSALPLQGLDLVANRGVAHLELTSAALPSLPGDGARLTLGSFVIDHGEGTRFSAEVAHVSTGGAPIETTVLYGDDPQLISTPVGELPVSELGGQQQTIAGLRGAFHVLPAYGIDGVVELGRSWYDAQGVARPGTNAPGGYYHAGLSGGFGHSTLYVDVYRMEPRYAIAILPYGVPENQWSAAFAWPGQWLKSNYQLIDNSVLGVNREGYRFRYYIDKGPIEAHFEYTSVWQIDPETTDTATQVGFVDGYYLPQAPNAATYGRQQRTALWLGWHPSFGDVTLDLVDDELYRPFVATHPQDAVSYSVPQAILMYSRKLSKNVVLATGFGSYAMDGQFGEKIAFNQQLYFGGIEVQETPRSSILFDFRRASYNGIPTAPTPLSPAFASSLLVIEQRLHI
jgi:hypothetical protein